MSDRIARLGKYLISRHSRDSFEKNLRQTIIKIRRLRNGINFEIIGNLFEISSIPNCRVDSRLDEHIFSVRAPPPGDIATTLRYRGVAALSLIIVNTN